MFDVVKNSLQVMCLLIHLFLALPGGPICLLTSFYLILYTSWRWIIILYLIWFWLVDINACHNSTRRLQWIRNLSCWRYMRDYFPIRLKTTAGVELDPKKNYLFCSFPHGVIGTSQFCAFATNACAVDSLFPAHICQPLTLTLNFLFPFTRDLALALGVRSVSAASINHILSRPEGGKIAVLLVGGASEAFNCGPNRYTLVLKERRGFVRLAIKNGAPLVPVISFGETNIYDQVPNPKGSLLRKVQEALKTCFGFSPLIPLGRAYTMIPKRKPITVLVGQPINVEAISNPTQEQIDALHEHFIASVKQLFEENKSAYLENCEDVKFEIE